MNLAHFNSYYVKVQKLLTIPSGYILDIFCDYNAKLFNFLNLNQSLNCATKSLRPFLCHKLTITYILCYKYMYLGCVRTSRGILCNMQKYILHNHTLIVNLAILKP